MLRLNRTNGFVPTFNPFAEMERLLHAATNKSAPEAWVPSVDVVESSDGLVLSCDLPGVKQEQIELNFDNGVLTITAEREEPKAEGALYHVAERRWGRYERSFKLPSQFDGEKVTARYADGVLTIALPKREEAKPRKIAINS